MDANTTLADIDHLANLVRKQAPFSLKVGIILGSGLGKLAEEVTNPIFIPYAELPGWPISTVIGHSGRLVVGNLESQPVIILQGRVHYYEGYNDTQIALPIRVLARLGIQVLVITNAAGAVNTAFSPGDVMLITDHLNLIGMAGLNPLRGPNLDELGPRFPDMGRAYDRELMALARRVAQENKFPLREGVYVCLAGPSFETPADLRFLRLAGTDAVGMSTVPETIVAHHAGLRVLGLSGISNKANMNGETLTTHEEVLEAGKKIVPKLSLLIRGVLGYL